MNGKLHYLGKGMQEGGEHNTDVQIPLIQTPTPNVGNNHRIGYDEQEPQSVLPPNLNDKEHNHIGEGHSTDVGSSFTQVFPQELGNINLVEYHTNKDKEPRPLGTESTTEAGSSPTKTTTQSRNRSN